MDARKDSPRLSPLPLDHDASLQDNFAITT